MKGLFLSLINKKLFDCLLLLNRNINIYNLIIGIINTQGRNVLMAKPISYLLFYIIFIYLFLYINNMISVLVVRNKKVNNYNEK